MQCEFNPDLPGPRETYFGTISKFGLDIGATSGGQMVWAVYAPSSRGPGVLAGTYTGATAEATVAVGLGANALIGGSNRTVALQPLSVTGQTGLNLAAGVASLELRSGTERTFHDGFGGRLRAAVSFSSSSPLASPGLT